MWAVTPIFEKTAIKRTDGGDAAIPAEVDVGMIAKDSWPANIPSNAPGIFVSSHPSA
jgi:hypothetical protein